MPVTLWGRTVPLQLADLDIGILWVLAMTSIGVYAVVLAGWSSGSNYPLLGSIRSTAQMVSYEVAMGLALVAVLLYSGNLRMTEIVAQQDKIWNVIPQFPAFVIYLVCGLAETNRPPFDLPEAESELVAGYHTEYSGIKFAMFYLGEYLNTVTVAAVATTLWLGGWRGPAPDVVPWLWPLLWFLAKVLLIVYVYIWVRATLPRFRYDRLMAFGWKVLIPIGLVWVMVTGAIVVLPEEFGRTRRHGVRDRCGRGHRDHVDLAPGREANREASDVVSDEDRATASPRDLPRDRPRARPRDRSGSVPSAGSPTWAIARGMGRFSARSSVETSPRSTPRDRAPPPLAATSSGTC